MKNYPEDSFDNMIKFSKNHNFGFPYLFDETQEIAKKFGAVCTPDFFGYNKQTRKSEAITFQPQEIIHVTNENTNSIFRGTSKLKPLLRLIELYYYMINFQRQFFKNNAIPGFVLTTDNILSNFFTYSILLSLFLVLIR